MLAKTPTSARSRRSLAMYANRRARISVPARYPHVPIRKAADWLILRSEVGYRENLSLMLGVPWGSIKHWLAGRRKLPGWVRDILLEQVRAKLELGRLIEAELTAYEPPPVRPRAFPHKTLAADAERQQAPQLDPACLDELEP